MSNKKEIRTRFRRQVFHRDNFTCKMCGVKVEEQYSDDLLDPHHITDRSLMPNGGYVIENGITLCKKVCHIKAEQFHSTGVPAPGFSIDELYKLINSSLEKAQSASQKIK